MSLQPGILDSGSVQLLEQQSLYSCVWSCFPSVVPAVSQPNTYEQHHSLKIFKLNAQALKTTAAKS